ncbi:hypothetical protein [Arthrobacter sp. RAF14]|uniref:hypothetical protein n=1 Tax=Arthrobacter sp. RAF14 TaxID=3233051 RepID=UPI003F8DA30C
MSTHEFPRDAGQENPDDTALPDAALPRTETFNTALPETHRLDAAPGATPGVGDRTTDRSADKAADKAADEAAAGPWQSTAAAAPSADPVTAPVPAPVSDERRRGPRVSTVVWGLLIMALAGLIIVSKLGLVALNGSYVLIGLMIGTGVALVIGGLLSAAARKAPGHGDTDHHRMPGSGSGIA